jgi:hypothetical protein
MGRTARGAVRRATAAVRRTARAMVIVLFLGQGASPAEQRKGERRRHHAFHRHLFPPFGSVGSQL